MVNNVHPLVTIAIPTYNRADGYLRKALASAMNQTYQNIEIIVSDNCSSDNFNYCLEQANGDYFLLLQDDDMIDSDFVEVCMTVANHSKDIGIIRTGTRIIDSEGKVVRERTNNVVGLLTEEFFLGWFAGKTVLYLCSTLFFTLSALEKLVGSNRNTIFFRM